MEIIDGIIYYIMMGVAWILGILMAYGAIVLIIAPFWKGEVGREARKSCLAHILIIIVPVFVIIIGKYIIGGYCETESHNQSSQQSLNNLQNNTVYICTGPKSTKFHKYESCIGLSHCSGDIKEVFLEEAGDKGYEPCKRCYE